MTEDRDQAAIPHAARPLHRPRRRFAVVAVLSLAAAIAAVCLAAPFLTRRSPPPPRDAPSDPRLLYEGPYRNIHPHVAYVGDKACASCHADISRSYRRHPMGRSLTPIADAEEAQWYDAAHHNPFPALGEIFQVERRGRRVWHTESRRDANDRLLYTFETEVLYAIGSGTRGRSYLADRDGYLFQTAISWYAQKGIWDLSPGFQPGLLTGRPVPGECLFCHANRTRFQEGSLNHYDTPVFDGHAIGCERCHGPGAKHVASTDPLDIVCPNTERLTPDLCEAVCEQCHLEGAHRVVRRQRGLYDFRPGLPLQDFWRVFVQSREEGEREQAVTHVEQMHASRCYQGGSGAGRMLCTSCHDPHVAVAAEERAVYYRRRCLACHRDKGCSLPRRVRLDRQADDSCIACHMPRSPTADIVHTAATDHRIPRRPPPAAKEERQPAGVDRPLRPFHPYRPEDEAEVRRDLGLALVSWFVSWPQRASETFIAPGSHLGSRPYTHQDALLLGYAVGVGCAHRDGRDTPLPRVGLDGEFPRREIRRHEACVGVAQHRPLQPVLILKAALLGEDAVQVDDGRRVCHQRHHHGLGTTGRRVRKGLQIVKRFWGRHLRRRRGGGGNRGDHAGPQGWHHPVLQRFQLRPGGLESLLPKPLPPRQANLVLP
jgi:hypothetical protein